MRRAKVIAGHEAPDKTWLRFGAAIYVQAVKDLEEPNNILALDAWTWLFSDVAQLILDVCNLGNRHPMQLFEQKGSEHVEINQSIVALFDGLTQKEAQHLVKMLLQTGKEGRAAILDARKNVPVGKAYWRAKRSHRKASAK